MKRQPFPFRDAGNGLSGGIEYAASVAIFVGLGRWADSHFGTTPWIVILATVVGFAAGFVRLMYAEHFEAARREAAGLPPKKQREVPEVLRQKGAEVRNTSMFKEHRGVSASFADWKPRRFGDPIPDELADGVA